MGNENQNLLNFLKPLQSQTLYHSLDLRNGSCIYMRMYLLCSKKIPYSFKWIYKKAMSNGVWWTELDGSTVFSLCTLPPTSSWGAESENAHLEAGVTECWDQESGQRAIATDDNEKALNTALTAMNIAMNTACSMSSLGYILCYTHMREAQQA